MDGSVKNLMEAEKEAEKIINQAVSFKKERLDQAQTKAELRINVVKQDLKQQLDAYEDEVSSQNLFSSHSSRLYSSS